MEDTAIFNDTESLQPAVPTEVPETPQPDQSQLYENRIDSCILGVMDPPLEGGE